MAPSSFASSSTTGSSSYDVFLNFRGKDTRNNFTAFLNLVFRNRGINVFMDSENLWTGEAIGPSLFRAIEGSKISIPIFSKSYAESKWCLMELAQIVQCHRSQGQLILPIFFDVHPSDVRHQTGSFEEAFREHEQKFEPHLTESWREALRVIGELKGEVVDETMDQAKLVELLAKRVLGELVHGTHLAECKYSIGMESRVSDVLHLLNIGFENVQFVGICGFGGIGKTTIAKAVYNQIVSTFDRHSFVSDVREQAKQCRGLVSLQKQLLKDIFKVDIEIVDYHSGKEFIQQKLCTEKVLLVLDDVDKREQVDALAGELSWFGKGSRVIITTRDEHILNGAKVNEDKIYKPQELDLEQSLQLFSLHAFSKDQPPEDYMQLSHDLARYSGGLPLTLKVIGSFLSDISSKEVWECTLQKLKGIPHEDVQRRLRISYDNLEDYCQKAIFLDAACFFIGWEKETLISFWEACGYYPKLVVEGLIQRSFLQFEKDYGSGEYHLKMHDQIRDMGRKIVSEESHMEPSKRSRLWFDDEIVEVLERHKGNNIIEGMIVPKGVALTDEHFEMMSNLRFLELSLTDFSGNFSCLPSAIRFLRCNISSFLPINFYHRRLVVLDMSYPDAIIKQAWDVKPQDKDMFQNLKVLNLKGWIHLSKCPHFSWFPKLERLNIEGCTSLDKLSESIGDLKFLVKLNLVKTSLKNLPKSISKLSSLKELILSQCSSFNELPKSIGDLKCLVTLDMFGTQIKELPESVSKLCCLEKLILMECRSLKKLPESIGDLKCLVMLDLSGTQIEELPSSIYNLSSLEELILMECMSLKRLPESVGYLKSLVTLDLYGTQIEELPNSISNLSSLKELILMECSSLKKLPECIGELKCLVKLDLCVTQTKGFRNILPSRYPCQKFPPCSSLKKLPESIGDLKSLVTLDLSGTQIEELPNSISNLSSLQELILKDCKSLKKLPESIGDLKHLVKLDLCGTEIELPNSFFNLSSLKELILKECAHLKKFPETIGDPKCLESSMELEFCEIGQPKCLKYLVELACEIEEQPKCLESPVELKFCKIKQPPKCLESLVELEICKIEELPYDVSKLSSLKVLILNSRLSLKKLPVSICDIKSLVKLDLCGLQLEELPNNISKLSSLKVLILNNCKSLKKLPESICDLRSLDNLDLSSTELKELPVLPTSLTELSCAKCSSLVRLPDLSMQQNLRKLFLDGCLKLEEIQGLEGKESLQLLDARGCYNLTHAQGMSIHSQGKLLPDRLQASNSYSLTTANGIENVGLILCVVLRISSDDMDNLEVEEQSHLLMSIDIEIHSRIREGDKTTWCRHTVRIEDVEYTTERDIIYIHHFKGFDWFGIPLQGKDSIEILYIMQSTESHCLDGVRYPVKYRVKFWKLLLGIKEPDQLKPNQYFSAMMVADFFSWLHLDDDGRVPSPIDSSEEEKEEKDERNNLPSDLSICSLQFDSASDVVEKEEMLRPTKKACLHESNSNDKLQQMMNTLPSADDDNVGRSLSNMEEGE